MEGSEEQRGSFKDLWWNIPEREEDA